MNGTIKPRINLRPYLEPFLPMLVHQGESIREEADANKAFHLGRKEYEYIATVKGHVPVEEVQEEK